MSVYFGNDTVNDLYVGLAPVSKGYVGTHLFHNGDNTVIDITYEKYILNTQYSTLYNTDEKPVKSAILKGNSLVNHKKDNVVISPELSNCYDYTLSGCKNNTNYLIKFSAEHNEDVMAGFLIDTSAWSTTELKWAKPGNITVIINSGSTPNYLRIRAKSCENLMIIEYQDGMENWDIPYFEGMQSVKMPVLKTVGKNLCGGLEQGGISSSNGSLTDERNTRLRSKDFIILHPGSYMVSLNTNYEWVYRIYNMNEVISSSSSGWNKTTASIDVTETSKVKLVIRRKFNENISPSDDIGLRLEEGSVATEYEPYKTNILTVNEEVELRGIGEVKDELNLLTGEVTQRIGKVVFDGNEDWVRSAHENSTMFYTSFNNLVHKKDYSNSVICDKLMVYANESYLINSTSPNGISAYADWGDTYPNENWIYIKYADSEGSAEKLKQWLSQNPVTVRYELITESVETVDISVVDQDGNNTKLSTFNDITHVTLSSEGLIPEAGLEVATKNGGVLSTLSLEMDDISTSQNTLEETANTQSENVDATMIATTEIYEQLL